MRFVIATVLLISSMVTFGLGLAFQGPFQAGAEQSVKYQIKSADSYLLIPHETLAKHDGKVYIQASGIKNIFYADAREKDIQSWIGSSNYLKLGINPETGKSYLSPIRMGGTNANPVNSDLWRNQISVKTNLVTQVSMFEDTGVLLASDGFSRAPLDVSVMWKIDQPINWPWILFAIGFVFLIAALITNYLGFRNVRKLRGPRRRIPRAPSGPKYRRRIRADVPRRGRRVSGRGNAKIVLAPIALLSLGMLSGCASNQSVAPVEPPTKYPEIQVVITDGQLQRIVGDLATKVKSADEAKDSSTLQQRVAGPALEIRKVHYLLQGKSKKIMPMKDIVANPVTVALPMQIPTDESTWQPRTLMLVTKSPDAKVGPQLMVLQQAAPRENYKLWYLIDLLPGNSFPKVSAQDAGALLISSDNAFLATKPRTLAAKYGDILNRGAQSRFTSYFNLANDGFYQARYADQTKQAAALKKVKATIKFLHTLGNSNIIGMLTLKSGGLVALSMNDTSIIKPTTSGSAVSVTETEQKILLNAPGSATGLKINYENMLLFYVPISGSNEKIRLLGASQGILSVKALK
jgi:hypothetical protein